MNVLGLGRSAGFLTARCYLLKGLFLHAGNGIGSFRNERQGRFGYHGNQINAAVALLGVKSFSMYVMKDKKLHQKAMSMGTSEFTYSNFFKISNNHNNGQHFFIKTTCF